MTDINPDVADKPIEVPASPGGTQAATGTRDLLILVAALPALVAVLGTHDVNKMVAWISGSEGLQVVSIIVAIGTPLWRQWIARRKHANEVKMAGSAADSVAIVKEK